MRLDVCKINENRRLVVGKVVNVKPGEKCTIVELEGDVWNRETETNEKKTLSINFWNNEKVNMAEAVVKAKVAVGSVISVDIYEKDGKISGNSFMYSAHWVIPATEEAKEKNIIHGLVANMKVDEAGRYTRVSVPIHGKDGETTWANITLFNGEDSNLGERAEKLLAERNGKKRHAIFVCGENKPYHDNANYVAYNFTLTDY